MTTLHSCKVKRFNKKLEIIGFATKLTDILVSNEVETVLSAYIVYLKMQVIIIIFKYIICLVVS